MPRRRARSPAPCLPAARTSSRRIRLRCSRSRSCGCRGLDGDVADVDDPRELADAIEEQPEVVIRPFGPQLERQRRVHRLLRRLLRREPLNGEARLRRQSLNPAQDVGDVLLLRQHRAQILEPPFEFARPPTGTAAAAAPLRRPWRCRRAARSGASGAHRCRPASPRRRTSRSQTPRGADTTTNAPIWAYHGKFAERQFHGFLFVSERLTQPLTLLLRRGAPRPRAPVAAGGGGGGASGLLNTALTENLKMSPVFGVRDHLAVDDVDRLLEPRAASPGWRRNPTGRSTTSSCRRARCRPPSGSYR